MILKKNLVRNLHTVTFSKQYKAFFIILEVVHTNIVEGPVSTYSLRSLQFERTEKFVQTGEHKLQTGRGTSPEFPRETGSISDEVQVDKTTVWYGEAKLIPVWHGFDRTPHVNCMQKTGSCQRKPQLKNAITGC
jgi:hypothetical protein